jgi:hypothetical protein
VADPKNAGETTATAAAPMFVTSAEEVIAVLVDDNSQPAEEMRREAQRLAAFFRTWPTLKPRNEERLSAIQSLMDLTRRSMAYAAARPHLSKPPSKP